jgi:hypothetical protein
LIPELNIELIPELIIELISNFVHRKINLGL